MGSDDMNGDLCTISLSGFSSGKCFTIVFSKQDVAVAEAVYLSISSRLPWDARSFSSGEPRRISKLRISKIWKSKLTSILSIMSGMALATPRHLRMCLEGQLFKSVSDGLSVTLPRRVYTKCHSNTLISMMGLK